MAWKNDQVSKKETETITALARKALNLPGDFVEMGCYKGDTSLILAEMIQGTEKKLWLYDSFEGLPKKSKEDESELGVDFKEGELFTTKAELKKRFLRANYRVPEIRKAWFCDLTAEDLPNEIAFCFLDGDLYSSIRDSLRLVQEKMVSGGIIIVHDYNNPALPGVSKAVDELVGAYSIKVVQSMAIVNC